jgi:tetratricopeptide (TPR) repeat protein
MHRRGAWRAPVVAFLLLWCAPDGLAQTAGDKGARATPSALARARALLEAGLVREREKDFPAAAAAYTEAIEYAPRLAEAHDRLGFVLGQQGRTQEALLQFEQAVHLNPALFDAQYHLGATRWWTRDFAGALLALQAAVTLRPDPQEARYYLGPDPAKPRTTGAGDRSTEGRGAAEPAARRRAGLSRDRASRRSAISTRDRPAGGRGPHRPVGVRRPDQSRPGVVAHGSW